MQSGRRGWFEGVEGALKKCLPPVDQLWLKRLSYWRDSRSGHMQRGVKEKKQTRKMNFCSKQTTSGFTEKEITSFG